MDTICLIVIFPPSWTRHGHCWKTGKTCSWRWVQLQLSTRIQFIFLCPIPNCQVDFFLSSQISHQQLSGGLLPPSQQRLRSRRHFFHKSNILSGEGQRGGKMVISNDCRGSFFWPITQGEVVSEWLDVDEVEEAFAKMRRAAGVRISIFLIQEPTITKDAISFFVKRWETW